jgi:hypothetical protein
MGRQRYDLGHDMISNVIRGGLAASVQPERDPRFASPTEKHRRVSLLRVCTGWLQTFHLYPALNLSHPEPVTVQSAETSILTRAGRILETTFISPARRACHDRPDLTIKLREPGDHDAFRPSGKIRGRVERESPVRRRDERPEEDVGTGSSDLSKVSHIRFKR